jgi:hypothetical protein
MAAVVDLAAAASAKKWELWDLWDLWDLWENGANEIARGFAKRSKKINHKQRCRCPQTNQLLQQQGQGAAEDVKLSNGCLTVKM